MDNNFNDGINLTMLTDFYEITMANGYFETGMAEKIAYFVCFSEKFRDGADLLLGLGLEQVIDYLSHLNLQKKILLI